MLQFYLFTRVDSSKEHRIESHVLGQSRVTLGHTKGVQLPTHVRIIDVQFLLQELVASHEVIDDIVRVGRGLIGRRHAAVDNLELAILNESLDLGPRQIVLSLPPHFEELDLSV